MMPGTNAIYDGAIVHKRLRPRIHALKYKVFAVLLECEQLQELGKASRLFSYNRFNLFSLYDRDHGDGENIQAYLKNIASNASTDEAVCRFSMLCYPRILGYVFNPLTVYFGFDSAGRIQLLVYEVNNTFGERQTYVLPVDTAQGNTISQGCKKRFYVSPFNSIEGDYRFRVKGPDDNLCVGIALADTGGPMLKAYFRAERRDFTDRVLANMLMRHGWMTLKIIAGIHYEAMKLWLKGLRLQRRPAAPKRAIEYVQTSDKIS